MFFIWRHTTRWDDSWLWGETLPPPEEWPAFWNRMEQALQADSPEQLAWLKPEAKEALTLLDRFPAITPYAAWLRQRLDYVTLADELFREFPDARSQLRIVPAVPANAPPRRVSLVPPPLPRRLDRLRVQPQPRGGSC